MGFQHFDKYDWEYICLVRTSWNKGKKGLQVAWNKGLRKETNESLKAQSLWMKNRIVTAETKRKMSLAKKGIIPWNKNIKDYTTSWKGRRHKPETIQKFIGRKHSLETRQKISKTRIEKYGKNTPLIEQLKHSYKYHLS